MGHGEAESRGRAGPRKQVSAIAMDKSGGRRAENPRSIREVKPVQRKESRSSRECRNPAWQRAEI